MKGRFDPWLPTLLLSGLALRLIGLDEPLIDQQAWRQTDTPEDFQHLTFDEDKPKDDQSTSEAGTNL